MAKRKGRRAGLQLRRRNTGVNSIAVNEYYKRASGLANPTPTPMTVHPTFALVDHGEVQLLYRVWTGLRHQGYDKFQKCVLFRSKSRSLILYFSGQEFFFLLYLRGGIKRSMTFPSRERALAAYEANNVSLRRIPWVAMYHHEELPTEYPGQFSA